MGKKTMFIVVIAVILILIIAIAIGGKKTDENLGNVENKVVGGLEVTKADKQAIIPEDALSAFNRANAQYTNMKLNVVALLGEQVVAGTNYMFLCKATEVSPNAETSYKVVIVYNDLENKATITHVNDFNVNKYLNENISDNSTTTIGGWRVEIPEASNVLDENVQSAFDDAKAKVVGVEYQPIAVLGEQVVAGKNYAILCYGKLATAEAKAGIYLITLYEDLSKTHEIVSSAYVDLAEYNQ